MVWTASTGSTPRRPASEQNERADIVLGQGRRRQERVGAQAREAL